MSFRQLAFLLFVGVLIDAFVVRALLVPALVAVVGQAGAWPGHLSRPAGRGGDERGGRGKVDGEAERTRRAA